jgi:hypothetical protein
MQRATKTGIPSVAANLTMGQARRELQRLGAEWGVVVNGGVVVGMVTAAQASAADADAPLPDGFDGAESALLWLDGGTASPRLAA